MPKSLRSHLSLLAVAAGLVLAGCGGGGASDDEQIRTVVTDFAHGFAAGDGAKACAQLTDAAKKELADSAGGGGDCAKVLKTAVDNGDKEALAKFRDIKITSVKINGDKATVKTTADEDDTPAQVRKVNGKWLVDVDA